MAKKRGSKAKSTKESRLTKSIEGQVAPQAVAQPQVENLTVDEKILAEEKAREKRAFESLIGTVLPQGKIEKFISLYEKHRGPTQKLFESEEFKKDPDLMKQSEDLKFTMELGELTRNKLGLVQKLQQQKKDGKLGSLRDLARLDQQEWESFVKDSGIEKPEEEAGRLSRCIEDKFPTDVIAHRVLKNPAGSPEEVSKFFSNYLKDLKKTGSFDLRTSLIQDYLKKNPSMLEGIPADRQKSLIAELKLKQRLRRLTESAADMERLSADGIHSAMQIARMGKNVFIEKYERSLEGGESAAAKVYDNAQHASSMALALLFEYHPAFSQIDIAALKSNKDAVKKIDIPDWETLFGTFDLCDCPHCRSVLSPGAYLTDILHFLEDRKTGVKNGQSVQLSALDILLARRPDLAEIELTCENGDTTLPYIDLVNEILEEAISPRNFSINDPKGTITEALNKTAISGELRSQFESQGYTLSDEAEVQLISMTEGQQWRIRDKGWNFQLFDPEGGKIEVHPWPQTGGKTDDLAVAPEHIHTKVYDEHLKNAVFPWTLPFNLWGQWVRTYLGQLGVQRHNLIAAFYPDDLLEGPHTVAAAADYLGMTVQEWTHITDLTRNTQSLENFAYWGYTSGDNWLESLRCVRTFLEKSGLSYDELDQLLQMRFVNLFGSLSIKAREGNGEDGQPIPFDTCDTTKLELSGMDEEGDAAVRIHDFVRLWRKLGWTMVELDQALCTLVSIGRQNMLWDELKNVSASLDAVLQAPMQLKDLLPIANEVKSSIALFRGRPLPAEGEQRLRAAGANLLNAIETFIGNPLKADTDAAKAAGELRGALDQLLAATIRTDSDDYKSAVKTFVRAAKTLLQSLSRLSDVAKELDKLVGVIEKQSGADLTIGFLNEQLDQIKMVQDRLEEIPEKQKRRLANVLNEYDDAGRRLVQSIVDILRKLGIPHEVFTALNQVKKLIEEFDSENLDIFQAAKLLEDFEKAEEGIRISPDLDDHRLRECFVILSKRLKEFNQSLRHLVDAKKIKPEWIQPLISLRGKLTPFADIHADLTNGALMDFMFDEDARQWLYNEFSRASATSTEKLDDICRFLYAFNRQVGQLPVIYSGEESSSVTLDREVVVLIVNMEKALTRLVGKDAPVGMALDLAIACHDFLKSFRADLEKLDGKVDELLQGSGKLTEWVGTSLEGLGLNEALLRDVYYFKQFVDTLISQSHVSLESCARCVKTASKILAEIASLLNPSDLMKQAVYSINVLLYRLYLAIAKIKVSDRVMLELSDIKRFQNDFDMQVASLLSWYGFLDTHPYRAGGEGHLESFYSELFQNKSFVRNRTNELDLFALDPVRNESGFDHMRLDCEEIESRILAVLGIASKDFDLLLDGQTARFGNKEWRPIAPVVESGKRLTLANLSTMYRHVTLAKALGLKVQELLQIIHLTEKLPFHTSPQNFPRTAATKAFIELSDKVKNSGFTLDELNYLLRNLDSTIAPLAPREEVIAGALGEIRAGLLKIAAETVLKPDPNGDLTCKSLTLVADAEKAAKAVTLLQCDERQFENELMKLKESVYKSPSGSLPDPFVIPEGLKKKIIYDKDNQELRVIGVMSPGERDELLGLLSSSVYPEYHQAVEALFDMPRSYIAQHAEELKIPTFAEPISQLPQSLALSDELKCKVFIDTDKDDATKRLIRFAGVMTGEEKQQLETLLPGFEDAIKSLYDRPRSFLFHAFKAFDPPLLKTDLAFAPAEIGIIFPQELKKIYYDSAEQKLCFLGWMTDSDQEKIVRLADDREAEAPGDTELRDRCKTFKDTVVQLSQMYDDPSTCKIDPENAYIREEDIHDLFNGTGGKKPEGWQRLEFVLGKYLDHSRAVANRNLVIQKLAEAMGLEASIMFQLMDRWVARPDGKPGKLLEIFLQPEFAGCDIRIKLTRKLFPKQFAAFLLLHKIAMIISRFNVSRDQLVWLFVYAPEVGWLKPDEVTVEPGVVLNGSILFPKWARLVDLFALRDRLPNGPLVLAEVFSLARLKDTTEEELLQKMSDRTNWALADLQFLASTECFKLVQNAAYRDEKGLLKLNRCFDFIRRLGVSARQCRAWTKEDTEGSALTWKDAVSSREAVKAKYSSADWKEVAKPLVDKLRERQRDALVAYLVAHPDTYFSNHQNINKDRYRWKDVKELYSYFLIDVQMNSPMITSRIKQACSSAQLFAQRSLMNLEAEVKADSATDDRWLEWERWMKYYRIWEANRKIFLFPENWIEPELRDDKSPFFKELENEMMQNEITNDTAEAALRHYLEKLDRVARLEICGVYDQVEKDTSGQIAIERLHVFARTPNTPHVYYYRQRIDCSFWTAWEKVDLDIEGDHLLPVVWNRSLYLFWLTFKEEPEPQPLTLKLNTPMSDTLKVWSVNLVWSRFRNHVWGPKQVTVTPARLELVNPTVYPDGLCPKERIYLRARTEENDLIISVRYAPSSNRGWFNYREFKFFSSQQSVLSEKIYGQSNPVPVSSFSQEYMGYREDVPIESNDNSFILNIPGGVEILSYTPNGPAKIYLPNFPEYKAGDVFIYHDNRRTFAVSGIFPYLFTLFYHPYVGHFSAALAVEGIRGLFKLSTQLLSEYQYNWKFCWENVPGSESAILKAFLKNKTAELSWVENGEFIKTPEMPGTTQKIIWLEWQGHYLYVYHDLSNKTGGIQGGVPGSHQFTYELVPTKLNGQIYLCENAFIRDYGPASVGKPYPDEIVEFEENGAYSLYNWELFFHIPLLIADRLSRNQCFEEAMQWFHYIFNPMDTSGKGSETQQHYWLTKPFFERLRAGYDEEKIEDLLKHIADPQSPNYQNLVTAVKRWRKDPFKPDVVARLRTTAYQKTVLMKYIDNLIAWGDQLFRRDTIESINEATQLYVLAGEILGRRPEVLKPRFKPILVTYSILSAASNVSNGLRTDDFSDPLVEAEQIVPLLGLGATASASSPGFTGKMLYFGIPRNDKLLGYWDTVADRLFKIRNGLNIEGVARPLALYEPPIDPAMLVRAAAAGLDLGSVLSDLYAPLAFYRFHLIAQKAADFCAEVKGLGGALLSALEKRDAESIARLRSTHEIGLLQAMCEVKKAQKDETKKTLEGLMESQKVIQARYEYYSSRTFMNQWETAHLEQLKTSLIAQGVHMVSEVAAAILHLIPNTKVGAPTSMGLTYGGANVASAIQAFGASAGIASSMLSTQGSMNVTTAGYHRRQDEWIHQADLASKELKHMEKQIAATEIRLAIAEKELENHELQIENAKKVDVLMHDKFTNEELYDWMVGQISAVYFQSYQLAYDIAKRAERSYQFELGVENTNFIQFGYWDSLKKGLLAGERLHYDLKRMEMAYLDQNKREYELTKHVSLATVSPMALLKLKETGECVVDLPEALFDMDHPGHYMRRVKSGSLSIPCVAGPYASVNCTLTLLRNSVRVKPNLLKGNLYRRDESNDDPRFRDNLVPVQSIATSHGQNDSGLFELNFRDERYLPFEGAGAISNWRIQLPNQVRQFDYGTISDVILHLKYTGREGGEDLKNGALGELTGLFDKAAAAGCVRLFSIRQEFPSEWAKLTSVTLDEAKKTSELSFVLRQEHFPFWCKGRIKKIIQVAVFARGDMDSIAITSDPEGTQNKNELVQDPSFGNLWRKQLTMVPPVETAPEWAIRFKLFFDNNKIGDLWLLLIWGSK
ncbi:MAG: neuraminidase-like domain-containing protein [Thermodesulfobacteriota bacterium]